MPATPRYFWVSVILGMWAATAPTAAPVSPEERQAYYGDLHLHTGYSFDAFLTGTRIGPDEAYRFARGEAVTIGGVAYRRTTAPLDFLAVTDHAEWMAAPDAWQSPESPPFLNEIYRKYSSALKTSTQTYRQLGWPSNPELPAGADLAPVMRSAWQRQIEAARRHYRPGQFTTLLGYEWTSQTATADAVLSLHRIVIFGGSHPPAPFTSIDSQRPEALWKFLDQRRSEGQPSLAIAAHPFSSQGKMFDGMDSDGRPIDATGAEARSTNEVLLEITQSSGDSEATPDDQISGFNAPSEPQLRGSYARYALTHGMRIAQSQVGLNPYRFGFVGSSDFHKGMSDSAEGFGGHWQSAGLTGVWAESNTREAIFAALRRKETFATSGARLQLRFFGGWDYTRLLLSEQNWVQTAYRSGVPMGGDLPARSEKQAEKQPGPVFIAYARKDPEGENLDRLQIVKTWLEGDQHAEHIYDVALADGRRIDLNIGAPELAAVWRDPDFDPAKPAAYYLRAFAVSMPRMTKLVAGERKPAVTRERGWASPIWYTPPQDRSSR
jgi:hypothetical protein